MISYISVYAHPIDEKFTPLRLGYVKVIIGVVKDPAELEIDQKRIHPLIRSLASLQLDICHRITHETFSSFGHISVVCGSNCPLFMILLPIIC